MKNKFLLFAAAAVMALSIAMTSCSEDKLGDTIFEIPNTTLDRTSNTFPLDTFVKAEFLEPYNLDYKYKMEDVGADMQKNLVPVSYENSKDFAVLCKYLWYDVYRDNVGAEFLKKYSPRIIHLIGSASYNPTSGTKVIGLAEGGIKISLFQGNKIDVSNLDFMNEQFFKTMHHEFSHILHQTVIYPNSFKLISNGLYNPMDWNNTADSVAVSRGFISPYGSSGVSEDWVEILANYIVKDSINWNNSLSSAAYDWELAENLNADTINYALNAGISHDLVGYIHKVASTNVGGTASQYDVQRKIISRDDQGHAILTDGTIVEIGNGKGTPYASDGRGWTTRNLSTGEYVDITGKLKFTDNVDGIDGRAVLQQKLEMVREWAQTNFGMDIDKVRNAVQTRQYLTDENGKFVMRNGQFVNALVSPSKSDPSKTQIEVLREWVDKFEALKK